MCQTGAKSANYLRQYWIYYLGQLPPYPVAHAYMIHPTARPQHSFDSPAYIADNGLNDLEYPGIADAIAGI